MNGHESKPTSGRSQRGYSLIELMVAITLGMLLSLGIATLFTNTNNTYRSQDAIARLQENGRFAVSRMVDDIRSGFAQPLSTAVNAKTQQSTPNGIVVPPMAPDVYVADLETYLPRWAPIPTGTVVRPATLPVGTVYPFSPRWLLQGFECSVTGSSCNPTVPSWAPPVGTTAGSRVQGGDVLTLRFISAQGWSMVRAGGSYAACNSGRTATTAIHVLPSTDEPPNNFVPGDIALVWKNDRGFIFKTGGTSGVLLPVDMVQPSVTLPCLASSQNESIVLYNLSRDLRTITYFLQLVADPNPDATPGRVVPTLMRVEGNNPPEAVASGVERLDFLYGVEGRDGRLRFLSADQVHSDEGPNGVNCNNPPEQYGDLPKPAPPLSAMEPGCLWRSVRTIEVHLLLNTINDNQALLTADRAYRYSVNGGTVAYAAPVVPGASMPNGLVPGYMMRREFTAQVTLRNNIP